MTIRIEIDRTLCLESGQCAYMQPEVFEIDAEGKPQVVAGEWTEARIGLARDAEEQCPSQAITITPIGE